MNRQSNKNKPGRLKVKGWTLIELMIVVAVVSIILVMAVPAYQKYSVRAKVAEGLSVSKGAKSAVAASCNEDLTITSLSNSLAGYSFVETPYVERITISGECIAPIITVITRNTGAETDPTLTISGSWIGGSGHVRWTCVSNGLNVHVPETCRS